MISKELLHVTRNRLQFVMSLIDLSECDTDQAKRGAHLREARDEIHRLIQYLQENVQRGKLARTRNEKRK